MFVRYSLQEVQLTQATNTLQEICFSEKWRHLTLETYASSNWSSGNSSKPLKRDCREGYTRVLICLKWDVFSSLLRSDFPFAPLCFAVRKLGADLSLNGNVYIRTCWISFDRNHVTANHFEVECKRKPSLKSHLFRKQLDFDSILQFNIFSSNMHIIWHKKDM